LKLWKNKKIAALLNDAVLPIKQVPEQDPSEPLCYMNPVQEVMHPEISLV